LLPRQRAALCDRDKKSRPEGRRSIISNGWKVRPEAAARLPARRRYREAWRPCIEHFALPRYPGLKGEAVDVLGDDRPVVSVLPCSTDGRGVSAMSPPGSRRRSHIVAALLLGRPLLARLTNKENAAKRYGVRVAPVVLAFRSALSDIPF
jgi:hypothetical protein